MYKIFRPRIISAAMCFALSLASAAWAQNFTVSGTVSDSGGEPVIGASVKTGDDRTAVVTDLDGKYSIKADPKGKLTFSYVGCKTQTVAVDGRNIINITLQEDNEVLGEVVVIGYGTMDKKEITSAVAHVSEKDFLTINSSDPAMLIQGKVPGVSIVNNGSGDVNNRSSIQIRGISSRTAGLGPLVVIDGVPGASMDNVNPEDIASFDVLKDGAASAIYGTRGSNGVIVITTKKGSKDGSIHTTYQSSVAWDKAIKPLDFLDADQFRRLRIGYGDNVADLGGNYDWWEGVKRTGFTQHHTISLSGGNERTNYRASVDYRKGNGIDLRSNREEYGGRASVNHTTKNGLFNFTVNLAPRIASYDKANWTVFKNALETNPTTPLWDSETPGRYYNFAGQAASFNSVEVQKLGKDHTDYKIINMDGTAKLNLLPVLAKNIDNQTLNTQVTFAEQHTSYENNWFMPSTSNQCISLGLDGQASRSIDNATSRTFEWLANYSGKFGQNNIKAMAGYSWQNWKWNMLSAENADFPNDALEDNNLGSGEYAKEEGEVGMKSNRDDAKLIAFFGRLTYDYAGRYFLTASLRHEGSSRFGKNNKWGNFPAVSVGWRLSQESFMKGIEWISELKLRADYGETGNQDFGNYLSLAKMQGFGYYMYQGKMFQVWGPSENVNPDLKWEKGRNWNVGVDFSFLNDKIYGSMNYFNRRTSDLLGYYDVPMPPYLFSETFVNVGTMNNSGFEFDLNFNAVQTRDFDYSFNVVGSTMKNKFVDFSNSEYVGQDYYYECATENPYPGQYLQRIEKGQSIGNFYMYRYAGFTTAGEWLVYDKDGDVILASNATDDDKTVVGNGLPKFTLSTTHTFRYRNFDLSLFFRGAFGFDIFNIHDFYYGNRTFNGNVISKAYSKNIGISSSARPVVCDYFMERGDYFKLDQINLGYTVNLQKTRFLNKIRVFGTVKNVFTLTKFSGIDPSLYNVNGLTPGGNGYRTFYPASRQFTLGVQVDF